MKKIGIMFLLICSLISTSAMISPARAADWGVGLVSNIAWWQPSFRSEYENFEIDPLFLWGPAVSVSLWESWSVSVLILQNLINMSPSHYERSFSGSNGPGYLETETDTVRIDFDFTLGYSLTDNLSLFLGYKYLLLDFDTTETTITRGSYTFSNGKNIEETGSPSIVSNSAACGLSIVFPVFNGLMITFNSSVLYSHSEIDLKSFPEKSPGVIGDAENPNGYQGIGANGTLSLSYFIESMSTSVSVGGRFQYITYFARGDAPDLADDYFYGILVSAMYLF